MIVVDIETTGLDPVLHSIIEIGAVDFSDPENSFNGRCRIWEGAEVDPLALKVNGYTGEELRDARFMTEKELLLDLITWMEKIEDKTIAGHNVDFDIQFLNETCKRCGIAQKFGKRKVDQHTLVYASMLTRGMKPELENGVSNLHSDLIMEYVGIPAEPKPHRAINGARFETEALSRLILGRNLLPEFSGYPIPDYLI
jgi:DNA polymerase III epsilon subunit-like protein